MKNKNIFIVILFIIFSIIAYLIVSNKTDIQNSNVDVYFSKAIADENQTESKLSTASLTSDEKIATMTVNLTNVGESQTATFELTNADELNVAKIVKENIKIYNADLSGIFISEYFDVKTNIDDNLTIPSSKNNTATFSITVSLKKAAEKLNIPKSETFYIKLEN